MDNPPVPTAESTAAEIQAYLDGPEVSGFILRRLLGIANRHNDGSGLDVRLYIYDSSSGWWDWLERELTMAKEVRVLAATSVGEQPQEEGQAAEEGQAEGQGDAEEEEDEIGEVPDPGPKEWPNNPALDPGPQPDAYDRFHGRLTEDHMCTPYIRRIETRMPKVDTDKNVSTTNPDTITKENPMGTPYAGCGGNVCWENPETAYVSIGEKKEDNGKSGKRGHGSTQEASQKRARKDAKASQPLQDDFDSEEV